MKEIRLGTRQSKLAIAQANMVKELIESKSRNVSVKIIPMKTSGDVVSDVRRAGLDKSAFTNDLELALLDNRIDMAVHSMKDLPSGLPEGLYVAGTPERGDARDVLVTHKGCKLQDLPSGSKIGTSSLRRKYQLLKLRYDIEVVEIHGNVDTRIRKVRDKQLDGVVVAACGLQRLGLESQISQFFSVDEMIPAACQGILAIEVRRNDEFASNIAYETNHAATYEAAKYERSFLEEVGGDCNKVVAAHASVAENRISFLGLLGLPDGKYFIRDKAESAEDGIALAKKVAANLLSRIQHLDLG
ncbi:MAG: hydroxymethylbilane synthase [Conexivisphaerales archaeon]